MVDRHLVTIEVAGRPATYATAHERPWKEAVRAAIAATGVGPKTLDSQCGSTSDSSLRAMRTRYRNSTISSNPHSTPWKAFSGYAPSEGHRSLRTTAQTAWRPASVCPVLAKSLAPRLTYGSSIPLSLDSRCGNPVEVRAAQPPLTRADASSLRHDLNSPATLRRGLPKLRRVTVRSRPDACRAGPDPASVILTGTFRKTH
jgi:hypothetical protein